MQRAEPEAVVGVLRELVADEPVEAQLLLAQRQALERGVRGVQDHGRRRLVDLAALDADEAILDVVDATDAVLAAERVEALDELDRRDRLAVERDRARRPRSRSRPRPGCPGASRGATVHS